MRIRWTRWLFFLLLMNVFTPASAKAQDLSRYRTYAFGMSLDELRGQFNPQHLETGPVPGRPATFQDVTWWSWQATDSTLRGEGLWQVLFRFHNGRLYRMLATYDRRATRGLTAEDMIDVISTRYGAATRPAASIGLSTNDLYRPAEQVLAQWEDSQYSFTLYRYSLSGAYVLSMLSKDLHQQASRATAESARLVVHEASPLQTVSLLETSEREALRKKNKDAIRP